MSTEALSPELVRLLWPGGSVSAGFGQPTDSYLCLPNRTQPRSLIPLSSRAVTSKAVGRRLPGSGLSATSRRSVAVTLTASGLGRFMPRKTLQVQGHVKTLDSMLAQALGEPVSVAVHLGTARANRKPVLEVIDRRGRVLGWGKLGAGPLTDRLVSTEGDVLAELSGRSLRFLRVPEPILRTSWQGHPLLIMTPLPTRRGPIPSCLATAAAEEVASLAPHENERRAHVAYSERLRDRLGTLPPGPLPAAMIDGLDGLFDQLDDVPYGCWHGDWTDWNMSAVGDLLSVWDWERFEWPVPRGYDELHRRFQSDVRRTPTDVYAHAHRLVNRGADGRPLARSVQATASLYLLDLATRYLEDGQAAAGNMLGRVTEWVTAVPSISWPTASELLGSRQEELP